MDGGATAATTDEDDEDDGADGAELRTFSSLVAVDAADEASETMRRVAAIRLQAAQRGKIGRVLAADEAMLGEGMARAAAERAEAAQDSGSARSSLLSACSRSMAQAARVLLASVFRPDSNSWETQDERLMLLSASRYQQATPSSLRDAAFFSSYDRFDLPDHTAPTRLQPPGPSRLSSLPTTSVHRFRLTQHLCGTLLPALRDAALQQRRDAVGVQVSNVGGWHGPEQLLEEVAEDGGGSHWYTDVRLTLLAALTHLTSPSNERVEASPVDWEKRISGWLNSSGPNAFNTLHDHGSDVEWSLVLFVATGETEETSAVDLGGSLLLKTLLGPVASQRHGFLPVAPEPGELWAFPGYMPHCVMPRAVGPGNVPGPPITRVEDESRQRVSAAFNVYSSVSVNALSFMEKNMASMLLARDRAFQAMQALRADKVKESFG